MASSIIDLSPGRENSAGSEDSRVSLDDFTIHGLVGEGEFGKVMMAAKNDTGRLYAMKVLRKEHLLFRGSSSITQALTEKQVLQEMSAKPHPFIVSLNFAFQDSDHLFLVMDFVGGGDLFSLLEQKQRFPEPWVRVYSAEIVLALEHVHDAGIIFRDLKPENVMVGMDGHLKLTDFGMSKKVGGGITGTICGTPEYLAPEVLQGKTYDAAVDWWTLGCLVYEMLTGRSPFKSEDMAAMVQHIISDRVSVPAWASPGASAIILALLCQDPRKRLGAVSVGGVASIKEHDFYAGEEKLDWQALYNKEIAAPTAKHLSDGSGRTTPAPGSGDSAEATGGRPLSNAQRLAREFTAFSAPGEEGGSPSGTPVLSRHRVSPPPATPADNATGAESSFNTRQRAGGESSTSRSLHSLTMELTSNGTVWRVSDPLSRLLGYGRGRQHQLIGHKLLEPEASMIDEADLPRFAKAFHALLVQLDEMENEGDEEDAMGSSGGRPGRDPSPHKVLSSPPMKGVGSPATSAGRRPLDMRNTKEAWGASARLSSSEAPAASDASTNDSTSPVRKKSAPPTTMPLQRGTSTAGLGEGVTRVNSHEKAKRLREKGDATTSSRPINVHLTSHDGRRLCLRCVLDAAAPLPEAEARLESILSRAAILVTATDMTLSEGNKELVRRRYAWSYNDKLPDAETASLFSESMTYNRAGTQAPLSVAGEKGGLAAYLDRRRLFVRAFPDIRFKILEQSSQGDEQVYTSWQWTGTQTGPYHYKNYEGEYGDIPPSGCRVMVQGIAVDVCRNGQIVDHAAYYDEANLRMQLQPADRREAIPMHTQLIMRAEPGHVKVTLHVAPLGAGRPDDCEVSTQAAMQRFYARKYLRQLAAFGADGFALCQACVEGAPVMLCTHAFARIAGRFDAPPAEAELESPRATSAQQLLGVALLELLEPAASATSTQTLSNLQGALGARRAAQELLHGTAADGSEATLLLCLAPFDHDNHTYFAVLLIDLTAQMRSERRSSFPRVRRNTREVRVAPRNEGGVMWRGPSPKKTRGVVSTRSFGSLFVHRLPASWTWFDSKLLEEVLTVALHSLNVAFTMVDVAAEDQPMVWLSRGFERMTGISRPQAYGRNCRFLQVEETDPASVAQMRDAIIAGEPTRTYVWNKGQLEHGFWNVVALYPGYDEGAQGQEGTGELRYYAGVCVSLSTARFRKISRLVRRLAPTSAPAALPGALPEPTADDALVRAALAWREQYASERGQPPSRDELQAALEAALEASLGQAEPLEEVTEEPPAAAPTVKKVVVDLTALRDTRASF